MAISKDGLCQAAAAQGSQASSAAAIHGRRGVGVVHVHWLGRTVVGRRLRAGVAGGGGSTIPSLLVAALVALGRRVPGVALLVISGRTSGILGRRVLTRILLRVACGVLLALPLGGVPLRPLVSAVAHWRVPGGWRISRHRHWTLKTGACKRDRNACGRDAVGVTRKLFGAPNAVARGSWVVVKALFSRLKTSSSSSQYSTSDYPSLHVR